MGNFFSDIGKAVTNSIETVNKAALLPITSAISSKGQSLVNPALALKTTEQTGEGMLRGVNEGVVATNPLNNALQKFNEEGIAHGGAIGKFLGNLGEYARKNPVTTTAAVYAGGLVGEAEIPGTFGGTVGNSVIAGVESVGGAIASAAGGIIAGVVTGIEKTVGSIASGAILNDLGLGNQSSGGGGSGGSYPDTGSAMPANYQTKSDTLTKVLVIVAIASLAVMILKKK